jgi:hypothetical protein
MTLHSTTSNGIIATTLLGSGGGFTQVFKSLTRVGAASEAKFVIGTTKMDQRTSIFLEFDYNAGIEMGDSIQVQMPGFTCPSVNASIPYLSGTYAQYFDASWNSGTEVMTLLFVGDFYLARTLVEQWDLTILATNGCLVPTSGLIMNSNTLKYAPPRAKRAQDRATKAIARNNNNNNNSNSNHNALLMRSRANNLLLLRSLRSRGAPTASFWSCPPPQLYTS